MIKDPLDYDIKVYFYVRHLHTPIEKGKDPTFVEGNIRNTVEDVWQNESRKKPVELVGTFLPVPVEITIIPYHPFYFK